MVVVFVPHKIWNDFGRLAWADIMVVMSIGVKVGKAFDCCQDMDGSCLREIRRSWRCLSTILSADWGQPTLSGCVDQGRVKIIFFCAGRNAGST